MKLKQSKPELIRTGNRFLKIMADGEKPKQIMAAEGLSHWAFWKAVYTARDAKSPDKPLTLSAPRETDPNSRAPWSYCDGELLNLVHEIKAEMEIAVTNGWWTPEEGWRALLQ
jgi:hypothetical protein